MMWRLLLIGFAGWAAATAAFRFWGEHFFFGDGTWITWFTVGGGLVMLAVAYGVFRLLRVPPGDRPVAAIALALPGMLADAFVVSHFGLVLPNLDPDLDKAFAAFLLWAYGFLILSGWLFRGRA